MDTVSVVTYSQVDSIRFAPIHVADKRGYFRDVDIEPRYSFMHGPGAQGALAKGEVDVAPTTVERMLKAYGQDVPFKIVASAETWGPWQGQQHLVARPELVEGGALQDYADLRGKTLGMEQNRIDPDWLAMTRALQRGGLTFDDVQIVWATVSERRERGLAALGIDVAVVFQPGYLATGVRNRDFVVWKHCGELFPGRQGQLLGYSTSLIGQRPDVARRWMAAYVRGVRDYLDAVEEGKGREAMVELLMEATGDNRETVEIMPSLGIPRDGRVNVAAMQEEADLFAANGFLPAGLEIAPLVDNQFVDSAAATLAGT